MHSDPGEVKPQSIGDDNTNTTVDGVVEPSSADHDEPLYRTIINVNCESTEHGGNMEHDGQFYDAIGEVNDEIEGARKVNSSSSIVQN